MTTEIRMKPEHWPVLGKVGISSRTIWAYFMGVPFSRSGDFNTPSDTDDWQRCHELLKLFPEWRARLDEVGKWYPKWKPLCDKWAEIETIWNYQSLFIPWTLHRKLTAEERESSAKIYAIIRACNAEGIRELERSGWVTIEHMSEDGGSYSLKWNRISDNPADLAEPGAESVQPRKVNTADKSGASPELLPTQLPKEKL